MYEYRSQTYDGTEKGFIEELNKWAAQGWRLVEVRRWRVSPFAIRRAFVLEREKPGGRKRKAAALP